MGYVPPPKPPISISMAVIDNITPTLNMLYGIFDIGAKLFAGHRLPPGLPRTYEEYVWQVYGRTPGQKYPWWK